MPGERLTADERRRIADGLAAGLPYAEIARRLGRPTSTVSREVARNGHARRYRAEHAHLATASRARRPGPISPAAAAAPRPDPAGLGAVQRRMVEVMTQRGLPRMASDVLTALYLSDDGLTSADLVARLRVSPASVSKAIGYLAGLDMVVRTRENARGRERYFAGTGMWTRMWEANIRQNAAIADATRAGADVLAGTPAGERLRELSEVFDWLHQRMARLNDELADVLRAQQARRS